MIAEESLEIHNNVSHEEAIHQITYLRQLLKTILDASREADVNRIDTEHKSTVVVDANSFGSRAPVSCSKLLGGIAIL